MTTRIALIRHGDYQQQAGAPSALQPHPLTETGADEVRVQARVFAKWLSKSGSILARKVHTSPSLRAWQTASIFLEELQDYFAKSPTLIQNDALCERSVGALANLTAEQIEQTLATDPRVGPLPKGWKSDSYFYLPAVGAESLMQAGQRVARYIDATRENGRLSQITLFFGHGASFRHAAFHMGLLEYPQIAELSMYHARPVVLALDGSGTPEYGEWKIREKKEAMD